MKKILIILFFASLFSSCDEKTKRNKDKRTSQVMEKYYENQLCECLYKNGPGECLDLWKKYEKKTGNQADDLECGVEAEAPVAVESESELPIDDIFYVITDTATKTELKAKELVDELKLGGYRSDYLWIPDYNSLSGAEYFLVYIGPFYNILECAEEVEKYREIKPSSYGIGVSNNYERVEIRGVERIKRTSL